MHVIRRVVRTRREHQHDQLIVERLQLMPHTRRHEQRLARSRLERVHHPTVVLENPRPARHNRQKTMLRAVSMPAA